MELNEQLGEKLAATNGINEGEIYVWTGRFSKPAHTRVLFVATVVFVLAR